MEQYGKGDYEYEEDEPEEEVVYLHEVAEHGIVGGGHAYDVGAEGAGKVKILTPVGLGATYVVAFSVAGAIERCLHLGTRHVVAHLRRCTPSGLEEHLPFAVNEGQAQVGRQNGHYLLQLVHV